MTIEDLRERARALSLGEGAPFQGTSAELRGALGDLFERGQKTRAWQHIDAALKRDRSFCDATVPVGDFLIDVACDPSGPDRAFALRLANQLLTGVHDHALSAAATPGAARPAYLESDLGRRAQAAAAARAADAIVLLEDTDRELRAAAARFLAFVKAKGVAEALRGAYDAEPPDGVRSTLLLALSLHAPQEDRPFAALLEAAKSAGDPELLACAALVQTKRAPATGPSSEATMREPPTPLEVSIADWVATGNRPIADFPFTRGHTAETVIFYLGPEHDAAVHRILLRAILRTRLRVVPAADMLVPVHFSLGGGPRLVEELSSKQRTLLEAIAPANIHNDVFAHAGVPSDPWTRRRYLGLAPATPLEQPVAYPTALPTGAPLWRRLKEEAMRARRPGDASATWPEKLEALLGPDGAFRVLSQCAWNAYELPAPSPDALYSLEPRVSDATIAELFTEAKDRAASRPIAAGGIIDNLLLRRATHAARSLGEDDLRVFGFAGNDALKGDLIGRMDPSQRARTFRTLLATPGNTTRMALVWRFAKAAPDEILVEAAELVVALAHNGHEDAEELRADALAGLSSVVAARPALAEVYATIESLDV